MKTKLTLSIDKELVKYAKQQAEQSGESVSRMFSNILLAQKSQAAQKQTADVTGMVGSLKRYNIDGSKEAIRTAYARKYSA